MTPKLPEGWTSKPLEQIAQIVSGGTPARDTEAFWLGGDIPWVTPTDITGQAGSLLEDCKERITHAGLKASSAKLVPAGTLLMTSRATLGEIKIAARPVSTNQGFKNLIPSEQIDGWYLYYQMLFRKEQYASFGIGSTFLEVSKKDTARFEIPVPPKQEQTAIAKVLTSIDTAIRETEAIIAKLQAVKQGLLHDLLTRGLDASGQLRPPPALAPELYQDSPLGLIPKEWEAKELDQLVDTKRPIVYGILMPGYGHPDGVPVVKVKDIIGGQVQLDNLLLTSPKIDNEYKRSRLLAGDLLFTIRGTVGRTAFVPQALEGANITQDTARIGITGLDPRFVRAYLGMPIPAKFIAVHTLGVAVQGINLRDVRRIPIAMPPAEEASMIADKLDMHGAQLENELAALSKMRLQKSGLMDDLLTGRVRVKILDTEKA